MILDVNPGARGITAVMKLIRNNFPVSLLLMEPYSQISLKIVVDDDPLPLIELLNSLNLFYTEVK